MPNWCYNTLRVKGDAKERERFHELATQNGKLEILKNLYPTPAELVDTPSGYFGGDKQAEVERMNAQNLEKYGSKDWYDWNIKNWGTKWGDCETWVDDSQEDTLYGFDTAWSPPIEGLTHISSMFPTLDFILTYSEEGMGYYGITVIQNGAYDDTCENVEDIEGYSEIDWNSEESGCGYEKAQELIDAAREALYARVS